VAVEGSLVGLGVALGSYCDTEEVLDVYWGENTVNTAHAIGRRNLICVSSLQAILAPAFALRLSGRGP
jgi:hypothetical protein